MAGRAIECNQADIFLGGVFALEQSAVVDDALRRVQSGNVDFGDAMLAAEAVAAGACVASFDNDFAKFPDVVRRAWV